MITLKERSRRLSSVRDIMSKMQFDAMLFAASSQIGSKGCVRHLFGNRLATRYAYGLVFADEQMLILPPGLRWGTAEDVFDPLFATDNVALEVERMFRYKGVLEGRVGVVGMETALRAEDFWFLKSKFPMLMFVDAQMEYETMRCVKSEEEIKMINKSIEIAQAGISRLVEIVKAGTREIDIAAEIFKTTYSLGAEETLFLTMGGSDGGCKPFFLDPGLRILGKDEYFIFSVELTGPGGYWVEYARVFSLGRRGGVVESLSNAVALALEEAEGRMRPGVSVSDVQVLIEEVVNNRGFRVGHLTGHGLGNDVIEQPLISRNVNVTRLSQEKMLSVPGISKLQENMVITLHPHVLDERGENAAYMADTFLIVENGAKRLSRASHDVISAS